MMKQLFSLCVVLAFSAISSAADTLTLAHKTSELTVPLNRGNIECSIDAQMPVTASKTLCDNLSGRISATTAKAIGIKSSATMQDAALSSIEESFVKHIITQIKNQPRDPKATGLTLEVLVKREYETSHIITFVIDVTHYGLDAKRRQITDRITLLKQNGKILQWNDIVNKKQKAKLCKAASRSLYSFFGVVDFANLKTALTNGSSITETTFPLPANGPAINADGLCLTYDAGEITSPDRGQPVGSIKLQSAWSYLTPAAKKWVK